MGSGLRARGSGLRARGSGLSPVGLTGASSCDRVEVMAEVKRFWSGGRRRFVARTLATVGFLLLGGLFTSEVLEKLPAMLRWLTFGSAIVSFIGAVLIWSDENESKEE